MSKDDELSKVERDSDDDSDIGFGECQELQKTEPVLVKPTLKSLTFSIEEEKVIESLRDDMIDDDEDDHSNLALT